MGHREAHRSLEQSAAAPRRARLAVLGGKLALVVGLVLSASSACSDGTPSSSVRCHVGDTRECLGPGACKGAQQCASNEQGFDPCECGGDTDAKGGQGPGSSGAAGAGAMTATTGGVPADIGGAPGSGGSPEPAAEGGGGQGGASGPEYECTPIGNVGCASSQNCAPELGEPQCVNAGTKAQLTACQATSDCAPGLMCLESNCVKACAKTEDCGSADASIKCGLGYVHAQLGPLSACVKDCDVLTQNCPVGQACYLGSCLTPSVQGSEGEACENTTQCAKGNQCLPNVTAEGDNGCSKYCSTEAQNPCAQGLTCYPLAEAFPQLPAAWGVCITE